MSSTDDQADKAASALMAEFLMPEDALVRSVLRLAYLTGLKDGLSRTVMRESFK